MFPPKNAYEMMSHSFLGGAKWISSTHSTIPVWKPSNVDSPHVHQPKLVLSKSGGGRFPSKSGLIPLRRARVVF